MNERHCSACGSPCDENGICTREKCPRRALQLKQKAAREASDKANEAVRSK